MWAVTLLAGVNDSEEDARALAELAHNFERRAGVRARVSLVPYNAIDEAGRNPFERGDVAKFADDLLCSACALTCVTAARACRPSS